MTTTDAVRLICGLEFAFPDYKEPLVQLEGGVEGYMRGTLPYATSDGRLPCAFCDPSKAIGRGSGRRLQMWHFLGTHVRLAHGLSAQEYRDRVGLLRKTRLVSEPAHARVAASISHERVERMRDLGKAKRQRRRPADRRDEARRLSVAAGNQAEHLNKRGTCRDQILAVAKTLAKANGGVVRQADLVRQGIWPPSYRRFFPSMRALCQEAAVTYAGKNDWSDAEMLRAFRELAVRLGRTPTQKDLGGANGTPSNSTYQTRFGGLEEVCRRLRLPSNSPSPVTFGDEIDILNRYAITGSVAAVARATHRWPRHISEILGRYGVPLLPGFGAEDERRKAREWAAEIARRLAA